MTCEHHRHIPYGRRLYYRNTTRPLCQAERAEIGMAGIAGSQRSAAMGRCSACVLLAAALLVCAAAGAATEQPLAQHPTQSRGAAPHTRPLAASAPAPTGDEQDGRPARSAAPDEVAAAAAGAPLPSAVAPASAASAAAPLPGAASGPHLEIAH